MKKIIVICFLSIMLCGCDKLSGGNTIEELMSNNEYIIIDVRTEEEYEENHIVGAINIPYDEIDVNSDLDKEKIIFVYCKSGRSSEFAFNILNDLGYTVYDLGAFSSIDLPKE